MEHLGAAPIKKKSLAVLVVLLYIQECEKARTTEHVGNVEHANCVALSCDEGPGNKKLLSDLQRYVIFAEVAYRTKREKMMARLVACFPEEEEMWDVIHTWEGAEDKPAHFLAVCEERQELVVAIRGTKSLRDALTDATVEYVDMTFKSSHGNEGITSSAHSGIHMAATWLIQEHGKILSQYAERGYAITFTGHSLGAGTATLATLIYEQQRLTGAAVLDKQKQPHCFAFAPPAVACDAAAAHPHSMDLITSVVHDDDIVPRASIHSVTRLYNELAKFEWREPAREQLLNYCSPDSRMFKHACKYIDRNHDLARPSEESPLPPSAELRVVGRLLHVYPHNRDGELVDQYYDLVDMSDARGSLDTLRMSASMVADHSADNYIASLEKLSARASGGSGEGGC